MSTTRPYSEQIGPKPIPALSLRKNFSWSFAGNLVYSGCQWGMLTAIAKMGNPEMVGQFALGLAITAPIIIFAEMSLRAVQVTDAKDEYSFKSYLQLRLLTIFLALIVIAAIGFSANYRTETKWVIFIIGLAKSAEAISDIIFGLVQKYEQMDKIAKSIIIKGLSSLLITTVTLYLTNSLFFMVIGLTLTWTLILSTYDVFIASVILRSRSNNWSREKTIKSNIQALFDFWTDRQKLWHLFILSFPLGFVMLVVTLKTNIPRYFLEAFSGERELGIYAALAYVMVVGNTILKALGQSASPRLAKYFANNNLKKAGILLFKLMIIGFFLGLIGVIVVLVAGKEILTILYRPEYAEYVNVFFWVMIAAGIRYFGGFFGTTMTAARYFKIQVPINIVLVLVTLLTSYWLISKYGLMGAAWVSCVIFASEMIIKGGVVLYIFLDKNNRGNL